jgi:carboxypeptidase PM20D1
MVLYIILGIIGILVLLLLIAVIRAIALKNRSPIAKSPETDKAMAQKYAEDLAEMIRCKTVTNVTEDPEDGTNPFLKLHEVIERRFPLIHEKLENIPLGEPLLFRWRGKDSERGAIVLMSHQDVVPATGEWEHEPFSGDIEKGIIWGRGTVDTKGSLCCIFEAVEALLAEGFVPSCDVYIVSSNNEETMGDGAVRALDYLKDNNIKLEIVSDEGGAVLENPIPGVKGYFAMVGIVEKGIANVKFIAKGKGGHASTPPKNTPIARLSAFVNEVEKHSPFKKEISKPVREMFAALVPYMSFSFRLVLGNLWLFGGLLKSLLGKISPQAGAMLQTTIAFTQSRGSSAANVIPETAYVIANMRFIMHQKMEESLEIIKRVAAKYDIETEVLYYHDVSPFVDTAAANYKYVVDCLKAVFPEAGVAPYVMTGGTDARHFSHVCPCTVRIAPLVMTQKNLAGMHAVNEHIAIDALVRGTEFYRYLLVNYK